MSSVRDVSGASVFPASEAATAEALVCALNRTVVRELASALNPTVNFQLGDVRLRFVGAGKIFRAGFDTRQMLPAVTGLDPALLIASAVAAISSASPGLGTHGSFSGSSS